MNLRPGGVDGDDPNNEDNGGVEADPNDHNRRRDRREDDYDKEFRPVNPTK